MRTPLFTQGVQTRLLRGGISRSLLGGGRLIRCLLLEHGDLLLDRLKALLAIHRIAQRGGRIVGRLGLAPGDGGFGLHLVHELAGRLGVGHHIHHIGGIGTVEAAACQLSHGRLGIVVVLTGFRDLRLKIAFILFGRIQTIRGRIRLLLGRFGCIRSCIGGLLGSRNLILDQIVEFQDLVLQR